MILDLCYDLLVAVASAGALIRLEIIWLATLAVALPVGAHLGGIEGVAIAQGIESPRCWLFRSTSGSSASPDCSSTRWRAPCNRQSSPQLLV